LGIDQVISWFATKDVWWSPYRLKPLSGQYFVITRGKEVDGDFAGIVESISQWVYGPKDKPNVFVPDPDEKVKEQSVLEKRLNVAWVGFFKRFYSRDREYTTFEKEKGATANVLVTKHFEGLAGRVFYFQQRMAVNIPKAETKEKPKVNIIIPFMLRVLDPKKAEFMTGKPEEQAMNAVLARGRAYTSTRTYDQLLNESSTDATNDFVDFILKANEGGEDVGDPLNAAQGGLRLRFGIEIYSPYIAEVELSDKDAFSEATQLAAVREAQLVAAKVQAKIVETESTAEAEAIARKLRARDSVANGAAYALAEAITEHVGTLAIGGNSILGIPAEPPRIVKP
jgi:regulator of protease activity HflC (stomatin/prohibitin superfamily)